MQFPLFNSTKSIMPRHTIHPAQLSWILHEDPTLLQLTEAVRRSPDPSSEKLKLGGTCLGGPFTPLPPDADHGHHVRSHRPEYCLQQGTGYRNTQHIDWNARTGLVLIDIDDIVPSVSARAVQAYLAQTPAVAVAWVSARGGGLKVGVLTTPLPQTADACYDAWAVACQYVIGYMTRAHLTLGEEYHIDATPAAAQMAILAHDPEALVRQPDPQAAVPWTTGEWRRWSASQAGVLNATPVPPPPPDSGVAVPKQVWFLAARLSWAKGERSTSMHQLGMWIAMHGLDWEDGRQEASNRAQASGMVNEYGLEYSVRHYDRGWQRTRESLLDGFGWGGG